MIKDKYSVVFYGWLQFIRLIESIKAYDLLTVTFLNLAHFTGTQPAITRILAP
ncbi:MAG TPA: hypothetical protein VD905_12170 [Flavobacteriales bacterium]|nr:hypothetical protein [Flavobacteriales bacterium]